ncbi:MAG: DUF1848 domain-containing protein [Candidatus Aminicenantes bacterium]|nr:DUF1848 domain-containing protein [Candidatus Aminicenantes bacterium]
MKTVISASRRTDLVSFFPEWLAAAVRAERAFVLGPSGRGFASDLRPRNVHTFVLWSKNFGNFIENEHRLRDYLAKYDQLYFHFTITGLGGTPVEKRVPPPEEALAQLEALVELAGRPERVSVRFDPVVCWEERGEMKTNLAFFEDLAPRASRLGIRAVRFSFAQWYGKAKRRAERRGFSYVDPPVEEKKSAARRLAEVAGAWGLSLFSCSQDFLAEIPGIQPSSCIDGRLLQALHPAGEPVSQRKDRSQRRECRCTESVDIGSYAQSCPHSCIYCYANPKL